MPELDPFLQMSEEQSPPVATAFPGQEFFAPVESSQTFPGQEFFAPVEQQKELISKERKDKIFKQYVRGLTHTFTEYRRRFAEKAAEDITDTEERAFLAEQVQDVSKKQELYRRQQQKDANYWQWFAGKTLEGTGSLLEGATDLGRSFVGPGRIFGGIEALGGKRKNLEDVRFMRALEAAKLSENPFMSKDSSTLAKGISTALRMTPGVAFGVATAGLGGGPALFAYEAMRTSPRSVEEMQLLGLDPLPAALAGGAAGIGTAAIEVLGVRDPTGVTKKALGPLGKAARLAVIEWAQKLAGPTIKKGASALAKLPKTKATLKGASEYLFNVVGETLEEGAQGAWDEAVKQAASVLSDNMDPRDPKNIWQSFVDDIKSSALPVAIIGGAGPISKGIKIDKDYSAEGDMRKHARENKIPSRGTAKQWEKIGFPRKYKDEDRLKLAKEIVNEMNLDEQAEIREGDEITDGMWKRWNLPKDRKTQEERAAFLDVNESEGQKLEDQEKEKIQQQAPQAPESPAPVQEPAEQPQAPEVPQQPEAAPEAPGAVQEAPQIETQAQNLDLNNAVGEKWLQERDLSPIKDKNPRHWNEVTGAVLRENATKDVMELADEVVKEGRLISDYDHITFAVAKYEREIEIKEFQEQQNVAENAGNTKAYNRARIRELRRVKEIEQILIADNFGGRAAAQSMAIRRFAINRNKFEVSGFTADLRNAKNEELDSDDRETVANETKKHTGFEKDVQEEFQKDEIRNKRMDLAQARKILAAEKRRTSGAGKTIKEKARIERAGLFEKIRKLQEAGENNIGFLREESGSFSPEMFFLIGRVGLTYAKEGIGEFVEVVESLRKDFPDFDLTDIDVARAIITQDPKRKKIAENDAKKNVRHLKTISSLLVKIDNAQKGILPEAKKRTPTSKEIKDLQKLYTELRKEILRPGLEVAKKERAIDTINRLQDLLDTGKKDIKKKPREVSEKLQEYHQKARDLRSELRVREELADVENQLLTGEYRSKLPKAKRLISQSLEKAQIELSKQRAKMRQIIEDARPWDTKRKIKAVTAEMKAIAATADVSFTLRQNLWPVFSGLANPRRTVGTIKIIAKSMKTLFTKYSSEQIINGIRNSENAELHEIAGLVIMDPGSQADQNTSEVFRGHFIENLKFPKFLPKIGGRQTLLGVIMSASSRQSVAIGNLMRTSAFDYWIEKNPEATKAEMIAIADYINKSTGLGVIDSKYSEALGETFFSPRFAISRVQTPLALAKYWKTPTVRNQIAADMVRVSGTGGLILFLAQLAGAEVEWWDTESADWATIRIGNTRWKIFGGSLSPLRLVARIIIGGVKQFTEEGSDIDPIEAFLRFLTYKFSPAVTFPVEIYRGKTIVGEEIPRLTTLRHVITPLIIQGIEDASDEDWGIIGAVAASELGGISVTTYRDSYSAALRRMRNFIDREDFAKARQVRAEYNKRVEKGERKLPSR